MAKELIKMPQNELKDLNKIDYFYQNRPSSAGTKDMVEHESVVIQKGHEQKGIR